MRVLKDLLKTSSQNKKSNHLRYLLSLRELDPNGSGWVETDVIVKALSVKFGVMPKTVKNNLYACQNKGFGNFNNNGNRFHYYDQVRVIQAMGGELTTRTAVHVNNAIGGSVVQARANLHAALLMSNGSEIMITRSTISKFSGRARQTQRKYERLNGTEVKPNFAIFQEYNGNQHELDCLRYTGHAAFISYDPKQKKHFITKQLPNTYCSLEFKRTRKKTKHPLIIQGKGNAKKVYFNDLNAAKKQWEDDNYSTDVYFWDNKAQVYKWQPPLQGWKK